MKKKMKSLAGIYFIIGAFAITAIVLGMPVVAGATSVSSGSAVAVDKEIPTPKAQVGKKTNKATITKKKKVNWKVKLKKCSHPKKLNRGYGFDVKGTLQSARNLKSVTAEITTDSGKVLYKKKVNGKKKKKFDLQKVDNALKFSELKKGKYVYEVTVTDTKGQSQDVIEDAFSVKQSKWMVPVKNPRWGDGWHCHCSTHGGKHYGWDISGGGLAIHAVSSGTVVYAKYHGGSSLGSFGKLIIIYHGKGIYSYYAHCSKLKVKTGQKVSTGDIIGKTGSTGMAYGPHLHFELRKGPDFNGKYNAFKLVDKYTYKQFNPAKKINKKGCV